MESFIACGKSPIRDVIDPVAARMRDKKLIIADGHHRYETAFNYRDECRDKDGRAAHSASAARSQGFHPTSSP